MVNNTTILQTGGITLFFLLKSIGFIIILLTKSFFYILLFTYKAIIFAFKSIIFLFKNKFLRVPTILLILSIVFDLNFSILSSIYFIYLMHIVALHNGIYHNIHSNIMRFFKELKENNNIKDILKLLPSNNIVLSNLSLENDDRTLNIYHLAITPNGLYNIIPLSNFLDNNSSKDIANKLIYDIYNETENIKNLLVDIIEEDVPLTTLILSPENDFDNTINIDTFKLIQENQLLFMINSNKDNGNYLDIDTIKDLILDNKAWFLDKIWFKFVYFINNNRKILSFFMLCPIIYCIYMIILTIFYSGITIMIDDIIKFLSNIINIYK